MRRTAPRPSLHAGRSAVRALAGALTAALLIPAAASAQDPAPTAAPAAAELTVRWEKVRRDRGSAVALRGDRVRLAGRLSPVVAGQSVTVRVYRGKRKLFVRSARVRGDGTYRLGYRASRSGTLRAEAVHRATPELATARARRARLRVVSPSARRSARGPLIRLLQASLDRMGYAVPRSGVVDGGTQRAFMGYRKVTGRKRSFSADAAMIRAILARRGAFRVRHPKAGRHVEADISRQVMALIGRSGKVERVYHISSGAPSTPTIIGRFTVYMKTPGTNSLGMVHSSYFRGGYAVHGYASVPPFNASHGCLRVPVPNAASIYRWMRHGTTVIVYP